MKTIAIHFLLLFLFSFFSSAHANGLRKLTPEQRLDIERKLADFGDPVNATLTFEDLGIETEEEGLDVCDIILNMFQIPIKAAVPLPIDYGCGCDVYFNELRIDFTCGVKICADVIGGLINMALPGAGAALNALFNYLPFKNPFCFSPTYTGRLAWGPQLGSELCTGTSNLIVDSTLLSKLTFGVIDLDEDISFGVPNICLSVVNKKAKLLSLESCHARIDGGILGTLAGGAPGMVDCPCEVCNEEGTDIRLNCPEVMDSILPGPLRGMFEFSQECMGIGAITKFFTKKDPQDAEPVLPLISPVLTMMKPIHANRTVGTIGRWYLVDAKADKFVKYVHEKEIIDQQEYGSNLNLCVETHGDVASVAFMLNDLQVRYDNTPPYCLGADDAVKGTFERVPHLGVIGNYALEATPFLFDDKKGRSGTRAATSIQVIDSARPAADAWVGGILRWNLVNTRDNRYVRKLAASNTITQRSFGTSLNICVDTRATVGSVDFLINGKVVSIDNVRPFCLGDDNVRNRTFKSVAELASTGPFMITATTYGQANRKGAIGTTESISLTITD